ncbi:hypothetical protein BGZ65_005039 [Modicella reniformis]|uniref:Uncharacterized protein n=1 Tax=Modicella reniformis TaxID=1440133 RepID=A0A9P6M8P5_9FUNG|nr:hypothetical protein BGZ65_005039 [Modicella reniformis]
MAIHEVLEAPPSRSHSHHDEDRGSPPFKRKGSPEDSFSDSNSRSRSSARAGPYSSSSNADHSPQSSHLRDAHYTSHHPRSPRYRQESPMPQSNSEDDDEDNDIRSYKKRRMLSAQHKQSSPGASGGPPEVMDQVRSTLKLKQQQKAIIEARQSGGGGSGSASASTTPPQSSSGSKSSKDTTTATSSQPNPKNAKSLSIFAPSYSDSSLSIQSAPLQPSHQALVGMDRRPAQPLRNNQPHPLSQSQHTGAIPQPLRSPKTAGHIKKSSRPTLRAGPYTAGLDNGSGTLPAPILSSHTGPLPSPMYPVPSTPFHPPSHSLGGTGHVSKPAFMETVSNLFDAADSSRSLKYTLEEQIRKSAQLLQTLQSSGTMIESLVRGQFKELEKGVLDKFEGELEYLSERVRALEEHQGLTPPPKRTRIFSSIGNVATLKSNNSSGASLPSPPSINNSNIVNNNNSESKGHISSSSSSSSNDSGSDLKDGTLPTPPLNKNQDSAMEVEDEELAVGGGGGGSSTSSSPPPPSREQASEYQSSVKKLRERVASLEKRQETTAQA